MRPSQLHRAGLFLGANPNRSGAADQRKWIVADQFRRAFELKLNWIIGEWANRTELIRHTQHHARRVRSIGE